MKLWFRLTSAVVILTAWWALLACSGFSERFSKSENGQPAEYMDDETRRVAVDQPFLLSGDHFMNREPDTIIDLNSYLSKKTEASQQPSASQPPPAPATPAPAKSASMKPFPLKIGLLVNSHQIPPDVNTRLSQVWPEVCRQFPVVVANPEQLTSAVESGQCSWQNNLTCALQAAGRYPGTRMLIIIDQIHIPETAVAQAMARIKVADTGIGFVYPTLQLTGTISKTEPLDSFLTRALTRTLSFCMDKQKIMPGFCRAFSSENHQWYITAGNQSGLKPGDQLMVMTAGKLVKSPMGQPAGWIPGNPKGTLKVDVLFGEDFAACSLMEGVGPEPTDILRPVQ